MKRKRQIITITLVAGALAIPACILYFESSSTRPTTERNPSASLKTLGTAQADFRANDRDGNGRKDYWVADVSGLYCVTSPTAPDALIKLIDISVAGADPTPVMDMSSITQRGSKAGYYYGVIPLDETGKPYTPFTDNLDYAGRSTEGFAFCAFPDSYGKSGNFTYISNEQNKIYKKKAGSPIYRWPSAEELADEWEPLR